MADARSLDEHVAEEFYFSAPIDPCELGHEREEYHEKYGADTDGNRWEWRTYECCKLCGEER
jgi:hypothetical protein